MKVHKYQITCYEGMMDFIHARGGLQTRIYIPKQGVMGFRGDNVDFFADNKDAVAEAEQHIKGGKEVKYVEEIELPDEVVSDVVSRGKALNEAMEKLQTASKSLIDLVKKRSAIS